MTMYPPLKTLPSSTLTLAPSSPSSMADSTVIQISQDFELKELDRTPVNGKPTATTGPPPPPTPSSTRLDRTLSSAANLVKLLPSGTVLAFQALSPSFSNKGNCYPSNRYLTAALITACSLSCLFFSFTDSLLGRDGKLYQGIATRGSFYVFNYDGGEEEREKVFGDLRRYKIRVVDYVHALFSVVVFLTIAFGGSDIRTCFFPSAGKDVGQLVVNLPLGAAFLSSLVFMIFPTSRKGIGYSDAAPHQQ